MGRPVGFVSGWRRRGVLVGRAWSGSRGRGPPHPTQCRVERAVAGLLFVAFFSGGIGGRALFRSRGADALLLPACAEAVMGFGYGLYRRWLRPGWKRSRFNTRARCELQRQQSSSTQFYDVTSGRMIKGGAGEPQEEEPQDEDTSPEPITLSEAYPISDAIDPDDERRPLSPRPGRCRVHSSPGPNRKMQAGRKEQPAAPDF